VPGGKAGNSAVNPSSKRAVRDQAVAHKATIILIEDKASGTQLIQELIEDGVSAVTRYKPQGDKVMRLHAQSHLGSRDAFRCSASRAHSSQAFAIFNNESQCAGCSTAKRLHSFAYILNSAGFCMACPYDC
jgi:hypothetical protein